MKKLCLFIPVIILAASCKKNSTNETCEITMAGIAGTYTLTRFESVSYNTGAAQDRISSLSSCVRSGIIKFNADSTATYTETTNCAGSENGSWQLSGSFIHTSFTSGLGNLIIGTGVTGWDCNQLVLMTFYPSVDSNLRFTFTREPQ